MTESPQQQPIKETAVKSIRNTQDRGYLYQAQRFLHRKWPKLIRDPDFEINLSVWRSEDAKKNAETSPPHDESIDLSCIWAVEFYSPAYIRSLLDGLATLGWNKPDSSLPGRNP